MKGTNGKGTWDPMQYFYAILWFAVGLILIFSLSKENRIFLFAVGFFLLLGAWWLADALLPEADVVALCLPGNSATRHTLDARRIGLLKRNAVVINVGRGSAIDTEALCDALYRGRIAGAALDVTDPEPLPADHPLWDAPNAVITPHISGGFSLPETLEQIVDIFAENLRRDAAGEPLLNLVDLRSGYRAKENRAV